MFRMHSYLRLDTEEKPGVGNRTRCSVVSQHRADFVLTALVHERGMIGLVKVPFGYSAWVVSASSKYDGRVCIRNQHLPYAYLFPSHRTLAKQKRDLAFDLITCICYGSMCSRYPLNSLP